MCTHMGHPESRNPDSNSDLVLHPSWPRIPLKEAQTWWVSRKEAGRQMGQEETRAEKQSQSEHTLYMSVLPVRACWPRPVEERGEALNADPHLLPALLVTAASRHQGNSCHRGTKSASDLRAVSLCWLKKFLFT